MSPITSVMRSSGTPSSSAAIWVKTVRAPCPMSDVPAVMTMLPSAEQPDGGVGKTGRRSWLDANGDAAAMAGWQRAAPADEVGCLPDGLLPLPVSRLVARDEVLAAAGEVTQPQLQGIDPEFPRGLV